MLKGSECRKVLKRPVKGWPGGFAVNNWCSGLLWSSWIPETGPVATCSSTEVGYGSNWDWVVKKRKFLFYLEKFFFKFLRNICWLRCQWHWRVVSTFLHMQMMQGCKYLSVVKALCINTSAYDKGPSWVSILKIKGSKISWHCSLKYRGIGHFELAFYLDARFLDLF